MGALPIVCIDDSPACHFVFEGKRYHSPRTPAECFNFGGNHWVGGFHGFSGKIGDFQLPSSETDVWAVCAWINSDGHVWKISWDHKPFTDEEQKDPFDDR